MGGKIKPGPVTTHRRRILESHQTARKAALGLSGTGFGLAWFKLKLLPPSPSPFLRILVPVAAIDTSC